MRIQMAQRTVLGLAISMVMTYPVALQALGLGELHSSSQLNQPLNAQIDLLSTSAAEARQLQVRLASPDVFSRVGIDRPAFLNSLTFTPSVQNGKPVIRVTSSVPVSEPFLNFLLEVSWPQGQLLKEYTVLLDPPVLMNAGSAATENAVAVRAEPESSGRVVRNQQAERQQAQQQRQRQLEIQRRQQAQRQQQQRRQQAQAAAQRNADMQRFEADAQAVMNDKRSVPTRFTRSSKYRVKRGDTVSRIASRLRYRGVTNNQMMLALFRANPHAFGQNNINNLKAGALLSRPNKNDVVSHSNSESKRIIQQHYAQWKKYRSSMASQTVKQQPSSGNTSGSKATARSSSPSKANLRVAGSNDDRSKSDIASAIGSAEIHKQLTLAQEALASSKSETAELRSRVSKLEAIIRKKDRLITLKNERLAALEAQFSAGAVNTNLGDGVDQSKDIATQVGNQDQQSSGHIIRGEGSDVIVADPANVRDRENEQQRPTDLAMDDRDGHDNTPSSNAVSAMDNRGATDGIDNHNDESAPSPFVEDKKESKSGLLDLLSSPLVAAIGGGGLLALLLGWFLMRRSSLKPDDEVISDLDDQSDFFEEQDSVLEKDVEAFKQETSNLSDVDNLYSDSTDHNPESTDHNPESDEIDNILSMDDGFDEDEVLQEVDVYIVYGLHEQAEDELNKAIAKHPSKMEYRYKLLENYKAADDAESFVSSAKDFLNAEGENKQKLWDKIVVWGKEIAPENELFSDSSLNNAMGMVAGVAGAAATGKVVKDAFSNSADEVFSAEKSSSSDEDLGNFNEFADVETPDLDADEFNISGLDDSDFDLSDELDLGDDDFGLDAIADDNVLDFGASAITSTDSDDEITGVELDLDSNDLEKILPKGNGYTSDDSNDDNLDDALSFLDISDDDEEVQDAHIGTKLDLARAYLDMGDVEGARHTLEEVVIEGNDDQKKEAEELLQQTG